MGSTRITNIPGFNAMSLGGLKIPSGSSNDNSDSNILDSDMIPPSVFASALDPGNNVEINNFGAGIDALTGPTLNSAQIVMANANNLIAKAKADAAKNTSGTGGSSSIPAGPSGSSNGDKLAQAALHDPNGGLAMNSLGQCALGVSKSIAAAFPGVNINGNAKDLGPSLLAHGFQDVTDQFGGDINKIPPGYVIVYQPGGLVDAFGGKKFGDAQITVGNGQSVSDHLNGPGGRLPFQKLNSNFRVYAPVNPHP